ncbi:hypothetical protein B0H19DRAFT_1143685 [Mycena capillaripes]|nr:hypothetical protein B0H19DRAFT_1143685 [Mycena capillaripes]
MHAFKFISVSAVFLLALMQGAVAQVALGGTCKWCQRLFCTSAERTSCSIGESIIGPVRILAFMLTYTPCSEGKCCILGPDHGVYVPRLPSADRNWADPFHSCMLTCP